jgi:membrane protease YdiL (CAAX protease family)
MFAFDYVNYLNFKVTTTAPLMKQFYDFMIKALEQMMEGPFWSSFLVTAIFAPIFEEWMCRGMVLRGLLTKMKPVWAIVLSALFFAIIHLNPWQALNAFVIGLFMGYIYYKTGSLLLTMLIHFVNNASSVIMAQFSSVEDTTFFYDMVPTGTYVVVSLVSLVLFVACLYAFKRIPLEKERGNIDTVELKVD